MSPLIGWVANKAKIRKEMPRKKRSKENTGCMSILFDYHVLACHCWSEYMTTVDRYESKSGKELDNYRWMCSRWLFQIPMHIHRTLLRYYLVKRTAAICPCNQNTSIQNNQNISIQNTKEDEAKNIYELNKNIYETS